MLSITLCPRARKIFRSDALEWDDRLLQAFDVPRAILPEIRPSSGVFATATEVLPGVRIGAGYRWASANVLGYARDAFGNLDTKRPFKGSTFVSTDASIRA